ncbi:MAG: penicillin-binding protein 2 [Kaiparowitsia implicata GSE-PSE-MK54-09C]|jgi:penicillin-binding protein 2|nr:penicillin-binding protein 2 [Kaiparowitsia implicata GSE-PSE-MK54-09C]
MALSRPSSRIPTKPGDRTVGRQYQSILVIALITIALMGGIGTRLAYLQLIQGQYNRQLADSNRIRLIPRQPERGRVTDRHGRILAGSRLSHAVFLWPIANRQHEWEPIIERLSTILNEPTDDIRSRLEQAGYNSPSLVRIARGITPAQITALAEHNRDLKGVQVEGEAVRYYPNGDLAAHILGYTGELSDEELTEREANGYRLGDIVGQMGVEAAFESRLRGEWGGQQVEVDGAGQVLRVLGEKPARAGNTVQLTLDLDLQRAAETALGNRMGAVVAIDPRNGAVLAMVSRPAFDPNIFSTRISPEQWDQLQGQTYPFLNRALQGFPPASTFKIVTATAGLESGRYGPGSVLRTMPYLNVGGIQFWDWNRAGFGSLGFPGAMAWSSNTFFGQVGMGIGGETLIDWSQRYGFGRKTGIEISSEESSGLVPDEAWKQEVFDEGWYVGDTINMSIGQGAMQATPLQVARMFAVPANGGYLVTPHLLKDGEEARTWRRSLDLQPSTISVLRDGLRRVVTNGTGGALNVKDLPPVAGKSGTAEDPPRDTHAWFGGYGPSNEPTVVVVAFVENSGGGGGRVAGPIVQQVLNAHFNNVQPDDQAGVANVRSD